MHVRTFGILALIGSLAAGACSKPGQGGKQGGQGGRADSGNTGGGAGNHGGQGGGNAGSTNNGAGAGGNAGSQTNPDAGAASNGGGGGSSNNADAAAWGPPFQVTVPPGLMIGQDGAALLTTPHLPRFPVPAGSGISRTLHLLASSTPTHHNHVKILYYGQSITRDAANLPNAWWQKTTEYLRTAFPNADIEDEMLAIGGFAADLLHRPSQIDVHPFYPDLIVFHDYGDYVVIDPMLGDLRTRTTAEILVQNWHLTPEAPEAVTSEDRMSYIYLPDICYRYGLEMVDVRTPWKAAVAAAGGDANKFVLDGLHLNATGSQMMTMYVNAALKYDANVIVDPLAMVHDYAVGTDVTWNGNELTLPFDGNRVEVLAQTPNTIQAGAATVTIDGKKPSEFQGAYAFTRANSNNTPYSTDDWPWHVAAFVHATFQATPVVEDWTLTLTSVSYDGNAAHCKFTLTGSVTGNDSDQPGDCEKEFISKSKRVVIEPDDWNLLNAQAGNYHYAATAGTQIKWSTIALHADNYPPTTLAATTPGKDYSTVLVSNIANGMHTLKLTATGTPPPIATIRVFRPPLRP